MVQVFYALVVFLILFQMIPGLHILCTSVVPGMALHSSLTCRKRVPLKHPIPVNTSINSTCIFNVSAIAVLLASVTRPTIK